jgi:hypothetical protein
MLAPRRIGKTSLLKKLCDDASQHGFYAVYCSFAKCVDEADCVAELAKELDACKSISQRNSEFFSKLKSLKLGPLGIDWAADKDTGWRAAGEELSAALSSDQQQWLVCIDELPVFIVSLLQHGESGRQRARTFLYWLRDLRQQNFQRIRWILAGSIGLDTLARRLRMSDAINDLTPFPLDAFSESSARKFLTLLADNYQMPLDEATQTAILQRIDWPIPYYLQLMFSELRDAYADYQRTPSPAGVSECFEKILGNSFRGYFDYWQQRLEDELGQPQAGYALQLLNTLCRSAEGCSREILSPRLSQSIPDVDSRTTELTNLLDILHSDGYLIERGDKHAFRMEWLREYWHRRNPA